MQGSGKSSVARSLAYAHDLQLYNVDHRTWVHVKRSRPTEFTALSLDERWVEAAPAQMLEWFVEGSRDRFGLILEDLGALPRSPLAVVEGPQLFPSFVAPLLASPDQALFLDREQAGLRNAFTNTSDPARARENVAARNALISERIAAEAREFGLLLLEVDRDVEGMVAVATEHFRPQLERGPRKVDRFAIRRAENEAVRTQVSLYRASGEAPPEHIDVPIPFACECDESGCALLVELSLGEFATLRESGGRVAAH